MCNEGDLGLIPGSGRSHRKGNGYLFQYSCLENSMDRGAWSSQSQGVTESHHYSGSQAYISQPASNHHLARWLVKKQISECHPKPRNLHFKQAPVQAFPGGPVVAVLSSSTGWRGVGLIPGWGPKIPHAQKNKT